MNVFFALIAAEAVTGSLISVFVKILLLSIIAAVIWYVLTLLPLPAPFGQIIRIIFLLIVVLILLAILLPLLGIAL